MSFGGDHHDVTITQRGAADLRSLRRSRRRWKDTSEIRTADEIERLYEANYAVKRDLRFAFDCGKTRSCV